MRRRTLQGDGKVAVPITELLTEDAVSAFLVPPHRGNLVGSFTKSTTILDDRLLRRRTAIGLSDPRRRRSRFAAFRFMIQKLVCKARTTTPRMARRAFLEARQRQAVARAAVGPARADAADALLAGQQYSTTPAGVKRTARQLLGACW